MLWIVALIHSFWIRGGVAPVGAGLEKVVVKGIADFEKDIGVDPLTTHDFVEVFACVADLMRQPGDASSLPRKLRLDGLSNVKGVCRGLFVIHFLFRWELSPLPQSNKKGGESFLLCAYLPLWYRQTPVTQISTE